MFDSVMGVLHYYRQPGLTVGATQVKLQNLKVVSPLISALDTEICFNIETNASLDERQLQILKWIIGSTQCPSQLTESSSLLGTTNGLILELGPR
jgi:hypothetical protein